MEKKKPTKRLLKKRMSEKKLRLSNFPGTIFVFSIILFGITQLYINATLTPQGAKLNALNHEKTALIEQNRQFEEKIARDRSLTIISVLAEKKLNLNNDAKNRLIYINEIITVAQN